jgi:hypothetical protein
MAMKNDSKKTLLRAIQSRAARVSVGASTVRGAGNKGVAAACREFLAQMDLRPFGTNSRVRFSQALDEQTEALRLALPYRVRKWGLARKVLNIFLRDSLYTSYLADAYRLSRAEHLMELPLEPITVKALKAEGERGALPRWSGVKALTPSDSQIYQAAAAEWAAAHGYARVHLDSIWWSLGRDEE